MYRYTKTPCIDEGPVALCALALIAVANAGAKEKALAHRVLQHAQNLLEMAEQELVAEKAQSEARKYSGDSAPDFAGAPGFPTGVDNQGDPEPK